MGAIRNDNTIFLIQECLNRYPTHKFKVVYVPDDRVIDTYIVTIDDTFQKEISLLGNPKYVLQYFFEDVDKGMKEINIKVLTDKL